MKSVCWLNSIFYVTSIKFLSFFSMTRARLLNSIYILFSFSQRNHALLFIFIIMIVSFSLRLLFTSQTVVFVLFFSSEFHIRIYAVVHETLSKHTECIVNTMFHIEFDLVWFEFRIHHIAKSHNKATNRNPKNGIARNRRDGEMEHRTRKIFDSLKKNVISSHRCRLLLAGVTSLTVFEFKNKFYTLFQKKNNNLIFEN